MKKIFGNLVCAAVVVTVSIFAAGACMAQNSMGGGRLAGVWDATVTLRNCETGAPIRTFASIANFDKDGTSLGSTSGVPQSLRTPEHGVWAHISGNTYRFKFKSFNFAPADITNPIGVAVSYGIVTHDIELDESGDTYTSAGIARFYLLNGTQVGQGCSDAVGTRFTF
jgi:hypothetical protein